MLGVIESRDLLVHGLSIVRHFGLGAYVRCVRAAVRGERCTFLGVLSSDASNGLMKRPQGD